MKIKKEKSKQFKDLYSNLKLSFTFDKKKSSWNKSF